jgi:GT2 family glycosyltransferase
MTASSITLAIATTGRAAILTETLRNAAAQTRPFDQIVLCPAKAGDIDEAGLAALGLHVDIVHGAPGLAAQRNTILRALGATDILLFIDDDFLLAPDYVAEMERLFAREPECVVATGRVLADGATNQGYSVAQGRAILADAPLTTPNVRPAFAGYGCNMAFRWSRLRPTGIRFDENLPLYAWGEDVDFSRQAARFGRVLASDAMAGVHLAEKNGRISGVRFGYSQIANQLYLARKGTTTVRGAAIKALQNIAANLLGAVRNNEAWIDRRGRLVGNLLGLRDVLIGRSSPGRILDFGPRF